MKSTHNFFYKKGGGSGAYHGGVLDLGIIKFGERIRTDFNRERKVDGDDKLNLIMGKSCPSLIKNDKYMLNGSL